MSPLEVVAQRVCEEQAERFAQDGVRVRGTFIEFANGGGASHNRRRTESLPPSPALFKYDQLTTQQLCPLEDSEGSDHGACIPMTKDDECILAKVLWTRPFSASTHCSDGSETP